MSAHIGDKASRNKKYIVLCAEQSIKIAQQFCTTDPDRFEFVPIEYKKFPDGTDKIVIKGFTPENKIADSHVLFFASFHNNGVTLSQLSVLIVLLQSFIQSLTIVLPFFPVGTMERVDEEGVVATASTYSVLLSNLPSIGQKTRLMMYDIHALPIRHYFVGSILPDLCSAIPLMILEMRKSGISAVAFPDDGANKRFKVMFGSGEYPIIVCGKIRDGETRRVTVQDGDPIGKHVLVVDDLVQTGGTLNECALALLTGGALSVSVYATHAVFPEDSWKRFSKTIPEVELNGKTRYDSINRVFVTNSNPVVTDQLNRPGDVFTVLDLTLLMKSDLDRTPFTP